MGITGGNKMELLKKLEFVCKKIGVKNNKETYMTLLLIGSESLSLDQGASVLNISKNELVLALNHFNIHYASI